MARKKTKSVGISSLLIQEEPLQVLPSLAVAIGLNEAIFLQQLYYWLRHSKNEKNGKLWVYNTFEQWQDQMPWWSTRTLMRIVDRLRSHGLIETTSAFNRYAIDKTLWYTINYDAVLKVSLPDENDMTSCHIEDDNLSTPSCQLVMPNMTTCRDPECDKLSSPITRDYQETTTETTTEDPRADPPPPILVTPNGGGGPPTHASGHQPNGNGNRNGHHATTNDSGALRSPQSLSARSLATEWAADFAAGWASLETDLAGWTDSQIRCLLTWLYVWAIEADSQDRNLEPVARYDAGQRLTTNYANVYAGSTNRIGLIKSKVAALIAVPLTEADTAALEGLIEQP